MKTAIFLGLAMIAAPTLAQDEVGLRAADAQQQAAARANDGPALMAMAHPNFRLFAPEGYIGDRANLTRRFSSAETRYTRFDRTVESAVVSGDTGVVMGREIIERTGEAPTPRRYTNVWVWQGGRWQWLARHAQADTSKGIQ